MRNETRNPLFTYSGWDSERLTNHSRPMTEKGALQKTLILFLIMMTTFFFTAQYLAETGRPGPALLDLIILIVVLLGIVIISAIKPKLSPFLAPTYAVLEGVLLGSIVMYSNFILEAFIITAVIFFTLLFLYRTRIIRVSNGFLKLIFTLTIGVGLFYLLNLLLMGLGITSGSLLYGNGIFGLLIAGFCLFVAISNLLVDFRMIEDGAGLQLPKHMEWFFGMSLLISIVWTYIEILRFLNILSSLDD